MIKKSTIDDKYYFKQITIKARLEIMGVFANDSISDNQKYVLYNAIILTYSLCDKSGKRIFNDVDAVLDYFGYDDFDKFNELANEYSEYFPTNKDKEKDKEINETN